jgi:hypothetical protein
MPQIGIAVLLIRDSPVHTFTVPSITFLLLLAVAKTAKPAFEVPTSEEVAYNTVISTSLHPRN